MKNILLIVPIVLLISCGDSKEEIEVKKLEASIEARQKEIDSMNEAAEKLKVENKFKLELVKAGKTAEEAQKIADSLRNQYKK